MTEISFNSIILAVATIPQPLKQFKGDIGSNEPGRVSAASGPIDPSQGPVGVGLRESDSNKGGEVVLVHVARRFAKFLEDGEILLVGDDLGGDGSVHFEPLGTLAPLMELDYWPHFWVVAASAHWAWKVIGLNECGF
uniref:Uncharacterized protein n=1 Tax=Cucumis sativus TaxID=3659 RepID=A0A0A0LSQ5_CUCSA